MHQGIVVTTLIAAAMLLVSAGAQTLNATRPDRIVISTASYQLELSKTNGAILDIRNPRLNASLTRGSRRGCLWGSVYGPNQTDYIGGCSFGPDGFRYRWNATAHVLTLLYASKIDATVTVRFTPEYFDISLTLVNRSSAILSGVLFPADLLFDNSSVESAYLPFFLPGVRLTREYFKHPASVSFIYPGARSFADFRGLDLGSSHLSWYTVNQSARVSPAGWGIGHDDQPGAFYIFHTFQTWTPAGATYRSPIVRFRIGQPVDRTILSYKSENGISSFPSIADKLGNRFTALSQAPLVKMDFRWIASSRLSPKFMSLSDRIDQLRAPALLHPVAYWPVDFDRNYPDFLPPDPQFGTNRDFAAFANVARNAGMFTMPYTNPTWWDPESPTVQAAGINAFAALDASRAPIDESYGPKRGFVVSPDSSATRQRLNALMQAWIADVPVDFVFQDQVGSRSSLKDFDPAAPDPLHFSDAWLAFTRQYSSQRLMTEDGWDRLAETEVGFAGSALTGTKQWDPARVRWGAESRANVLFGSGTWEPYPLGTFLFHDKVLLYNHDLDTAPMDAGPEVLTWNALFGVMGGYIWPDGYKYAHPDWPDIISAFQRAALARMAGKPLTSYRQLEPDVYESRFEDISAIANWRPDRAYDVDGFGIAPSGCLIRSGDRSLVAGIFTTEFNGNRLSSGTHYLIVEASRVAITVRQPSGPDSDLTIDIPAGLTPVEAHAFDLNSHVIATIPLSATGAQIRFHYANNISATHVDRYEITLQ